MNTDMKTFHSITLVLLAGAVMAVSCNKKDPVYTITADRTSILEIAANNPGIEAMIITTDAPYWIVTTPDWIKPSAIHGVGGGESRIITFTIAPNYRNEATTTLARSGEIKFSGGRTSLTIPVSQQGHEAYIDPSLSIGGIPSVSEFLDFVEAVNDGEATIRWMNSDYEIELLADIDLSGVSEWTPIGNAEKSGNSNNASKASGNTFEGVFNGGGHTIRGFNVTADIGEQGTWGLFGYLSHATVKNLNVEANLNLTASGMADAGVIAGTVYCSTIENVKVTATINSTGTTTTKRFSVGGIAGFMFSSYDLNNQTSYDSFIKDCEVTATVNMDCGANAANNVSCAMYGGIVGFATNIKDDSRNHIENCVNNGTMKVRLGRCSGIVPTCNYGTIVKGCTNNASQVNTIVGGRIGQIVCNISTNSALIDCVNNGDLTTTDPGTTTGALAALVGDDTVYIEGGERIANTGTILGCNTSYLGLIGANMTHFDHISNIVLSGHLGVYKSDGNHEMYAVNSSNIMSYVGKIGSGYAEKMTNITYITSGPEPETPSEGGGISDLDPVDDTWN